MLYIEELENHHIVNLFALLIGLLYGAIAQKTQFCFSGAIKDYILNHSTRRAASLLTAIITAIVASQVLGHIYFIDFTQSIYLKEEINYVAIILGGALFGIGMMLADGCSSRHLVKFAQGNLHSLVTVIFIAIFAYATAKGIFASGFNQIIDSRWLMHLTSLVPNNALSPFIVVPLLLVILISMLPSPKAILKCMDGALIGLLVGTAWLITGMWGSDPFDPIALEGLSFVFPSGKTLEYLMYFSGASLSFGVTVIFGILIGSFTMSLFNKKYRFGCTSTDQEAKLKKAMIGGSLMGIGGILALGCTIGQGLTGLSTLAFASILATLSITLSAYFTARVMAKQEALPGCFIFEW